MNEDIFNGTIEGNIASGIERWLQRGILHVGWALRGQKQREIARTVYDLMDAESWIQSSCTDDTDLAYYCNHDPFEMFYVGFQIATCRRELDTTQVASWKITNDLYDMRVCLIWKENARGVVRYKGTW